jgi:predicted transcriptional regulator
MLIEELIKLILEAKGNKTLNSFAKQCKIAPSTLSRILNKKKLNTLKSISDNSNVSLLKLLKASGYITDSMIEEMRKDNS